MKTNTAGRSVVIPEYSLDIQTKWWPCFSVIQIVSKYVVGCPYIDYCHHSECCRRELEVGEWEEQPSMFSAAPHN